MACSLGVCWRSGFTVHVFPGPVCLVCSSAGPLVGLAGLTYSSVQQPEGRGPRSSTCIAKEREVVLLGFRSSAESIPAKAMPVFAKRFLCPENFSQETVSVDLIAGQIDKQQYVLNSYH